MPENKFDLREYLKAELKEIEIFKWIKSEKEKHDIGQIRAIEEWHDLYGLSFQEYWKEEKEIEKKQ